jgi:EmrB/QacA subfamily drug resistance transporter
MNSAVPESVAPGDALVHDPRALRNILIGMITALVAVISAMSGLNVAQQHIATSLGSSQNGILWIINAYTLTLAASLLPVGAIGDRWGRKKVLVTGLFVFGLATVGALVANSTGAMIAARVVAGVGAAMIMPVTLSIITSSFPPENRGKAIGVWAGFAGGGGMIGLFVSAFAIDVLSWRWVFALPLLLVAASFFFTTKYAPDSRDESHHRFDVAGSILSALAVGGVVFGVHEGPERGWSDVLTLAGIIVGIVAGIVFVVVERRHINPLLDVSLFRDRRLASSTLGLVIMFAAMFGIFLVLFPFFQAILGWSSLHSASAMLPMMFMMMPLSTVAPKVAKKFGRRNTMAAGLATFAAGLVTMASFATVERGYTAILPGLLLIGLGMGLAMTPATEAITESLPVEKQGVASAINDTTRELGASVGVALLGSILSARFRTEITSRLAGMPAATAHTAGEGLASAYGVAANAGKDAPKIIDAAQHAFVDAWVTSMWLGAALVGLGVVYLVAFGPKRED